MLVKYEGGGKSISASNAGHIVAIAGHTNVRLLHISSGEVVQNLNVEANSIMMSSDGEKVLTGCSSGSVEVYDVLTGMLDLKCSSNLGGCVVFVHWDDEFIIAATGAADGPICWNIIGDDDYKYETYDRKFMWIYLSCCIRGNNICAKNCFKSIARSL